MDYATPNLCVCCCIVAAARTGWALEQVVRFRQSAATHFWVTSARFTMLRTSLSSLFVTSLESSCASFLKRAAGSLPKPITAQGSPTIEEGRQAFEGDLRSTSGLGVTDGIANHTDKWLQVCHHTPSHLLREYCDSAWPRCHFICLDPGLW